jgi:Holliday junction resolvase RusA-like endonuclease
VSVQATSASARNRWKDAVASAARANLPQRRGGYSPVEGLLVVTMVQFYKDSQALDTDNMIKPVLDAIKKVVFCDDEQIVDVRAGARELRGEYDITNVSDTLWTALTDASGPFVYVLTAPLPDNLEVLP